MLSISKTAIAIFFSAIFLVNFSAISADYSVDLSAPVNSGSDYNNATITNSGTLESSDHIGGYVYLSGTVDGNIDINNSGSITSTHSNYGVFYFPNIGNTSSLKTVSVTNSGSLISSGAFATPIYIIGKNDGSFPSVTKRSFNFSMNNEAAGQIGSASYGIQILNGNLGTFNLDNFGTISTSSSSASAIYFSGGVTATITNSGTISASSATAITIGASNATITNSGTITGNINLGSNASSSLIINGGSVSGNIDGAGGISLNSNLTTNGNIGASTALSSLTIAASKTLNAATNDNSIRVTNIILNSGSILSMGEGVLTGTVNGSASGRGTVNITLDSNANVIANLGSSASLAAVNFAANSGAVITTTATINASEVSMVGIDGALILGSSVGVNGIL